MSVCVFFADMVIMLIICLCRHNNEKKKMESSFEPDGHTGLM